MRDLQRQRIPLSFFEGLVKIEFVGNQPEEADIVDVTPTALLVPSPKLAPIMIT
jgi:hypothetical protein